jgi:hypothetical protein
LDVDVHSGVETEDEPIVVAVKHEVAACEQDLAGS